MSEESTSRLVKLSDVRDQDRTIEALRRELEHERIHHAHLFIGPDGVGKSLAAYGWASRLLCAHPVGIDACGQCASCKKLASGVHPDLLEVFADGRFIKIDQVRAVTDATRFRPNEGRWRVVILQSVEHLNEAAANALLKTLEEPNGSTVFVLTTSTPQRVLSTIRSRCLPLRFTPLSSETCAELLSRFEVDRERALVLARMAGGSPGKALSLSQSQAIDERDEVLRQMVAIARGDLVTGLRWASALSLVHEKELLEERLNVWIGVLRDAAVLSSSKDSSLAHHQDILADIERLVKVLPLAAIYKWIEALERALTRLSGNVQPRLLVESLMIDFSNAA